MRFSMKGILMETGSTGNFLSLWSVEKIETVEKWRKELRG